VQAAPGFLLSNRNVLQPAPFAANGIPWHLPLPTTSMPLTAQMSG
jgi:hypothetical protein